MEDGGEGDDVVRGRIDGILEKKREGRAAIRMAAIARERRERPYPPHVASPPSSASSSSMSSITHHCLLRAATSSVRRDGDDDGTMTHVAEDGGGGDKRASTMAVVVVVAGGGGEEDDVDAATDGGIFPDGGRDADAAAVRGAMRDSRMWQSSSGDEDVPSAVDHGEEFTSGNCGGREEERHPDERDGRQQLRFGVGSSDRRGRELSGGGEHPPDDGHGRDQPGIVEYYHTDKQGRAPFSGEGSYPDRHGQDQPRPSFTFATAPTPSTSLPVSSRTMTPNRTNAPSRTAIEASHVEDVLTLSLELERARSELASALRQLSDVTALGDKLQARNDKLQRESIALHARFEWETERSAAELSSLRRQLLVERGKSKAAEDDATLALELAKESQSNREECEMWLSRSLEEMDLWKGRYVKLKEERRRCGEGGDDAEGGWGQSLDGPRKIVRFRDENGGEDDGSRQEGWGGEGCYWGSP